jgi:hypothetical protein
MANKAVKLCRDASVKECLLKEPYCLLSCLLSNSLALGRVWGELALLSFCRLEMIGRCSVAVVNCVKMEGEREKIKQACKMARLSGRPKQLPATDSVNLRKGAKNCAGG